MEKQREQINLLHYSLKALVLILILGTYVVLAQHGGFEARSMSRESSQVQCTDPSIVG